MGIDPFFAVAAATAVLTLAIVFLPAAIELRHPKDAGPRIIGGCLEVTSISPVLNIELGAQKGGFTRCGVLDMLPNLEIEVI